MSRQPSGQLTSRGQLTGRHVRSRLAGYDHRAGLKRLLMVLACAVFVVGCGASDGAGLRSGGGLPTVPAGGVVAVVPSTTTPVRLVGVDCVGGAVEVAERVLIERRRGFMAVACDGSSVLGGAGGCWLVCEDGRRFVDFDLDTTRPGHRRRVDGAGEAVVVDFAARYGTAVADGTTTVAESLVLTRSDPARGWTVAGLEVIDTTAARAAAATTMENYFAALRAADYATAVGLMDPAESVAGRDDLGRLADEGLLSGTSPAEVAAALQRWCERGAECMAIPDVEIEVTATHSLRAIATYHLPLGAFETTFRIEGSLIVGLPISVR